MNSTEQCVPVGKMIKFKYFLFPINLTAKRNFYLKQNRVQLFVSKITFMKSLLLKWYKLFGIVVTIVSYVLRDTFREKHFEEKWWKKFFPRWAKKLRTLNIKLYWKQKLSGLVVKTAFYVSGGTVKVSEKTWTLNCQILEKKCSHTERTISWIVTTDNFEEIIFFLLNFTAKKTRTQKCCNIFHWKCVGKSSKINFEENFLSKLIFTCPRENFPHFLEKNINWEL